jgi:hypothetical protein
MMLCHTLTLAVVMLCGLAVGLGLGIAVNLLNGRTL